MQDDINNRGISELDKAAVLEKIAMKDKESYLKLEISADGLTARLAIEPGTLNSIKDNFPLQFFYKNEIAKNLEYTVSEIKEYLAAKGVVFGLIESAIIDFVASKPLDSFIDIASGIAAVDGKDGFLTENFERTLELVPQQLENGLVDYKELNFIRDVEKFTVITEITKATLAVPGKDVRGNVLEGKDGKEPKIQVGKNTRVSPDGSAIVAEIAGNLEYTNNGFIIKDTVTIPTSIDNNTGNINFSGDIVINGDVRFGYSVKSKKTITVMGMVEGAFLSAEGDITIKSGINGRLKGEIVCKGNIVTKFIENCTVAAEGNITSEVIINSNVSSEKGIFVANGKGVIAGGVVTAVERIESKILGSNLNLPTLLQLGTTPGINSKIEELQINIVELEKEIELIAKNIQYLEILEARGELTAERNQLYLKMKTQRPAKNMLLKRLQSALAAKKATIADPTACRLITGEINPPTKIIIGTVQKLITKNYGKSTIFISNGEIIVSNI